MNLENVMFKSIFNNSFKLPMKRNLFQHNLKI